MTNRTQHQFYAALKQLLPRGFAWPTDPRSVLQRCIKGIAGLFADHHDFVHAQSNAGLPHQTTTQIKAWEQATGLPNPCLGSDAAMSSRRDALVSTLRAPHASLAYDDSSPAAPATIEHIAEQAGFGVIVTPSRPLRTGRRVGQRLGTNGTLIIQLINHGSQPLRVGQCVGARLRTRHDQPLYCLLPLIIPARFNFVITEEKL